MRNMILKKVGLQEGFGRTLQFLKVNALFLNVVEVTPCHHYDIQKEDMTSNSIKRNIIYNLIFKY